MQIQNSSAHATTFLSARKTEAQIQQQSSGETSNEVTTTPSGDSVATKTTASYLSAETMGYIIQNAQAEETSNANTSLPIGAVHHFEQIANDPEYAAKQAELFGTSMELVGIKEEEFPKNGSPDSVWNDFYAKQDSRTEQVKEAYRERSSYYYSLKEQGLAPAEIYAKLLEFNANLPASYGSSIGWSGFGTAMSYSEFYQADHDYLQSLIDRSDTTDSSNLT